eukprot:3940002-Rhodomonas_salina.1
MVTRQRVVRYRNGHAAARYCARSGHGPGSQRWSTPSWTRGPPQRAQGRGLEQGLRQTACASAPHRPCARPNRHNHRPNRHNPPPTPQHHHAHPPTQPDGASSSLFPHRGRLPQRRSKPCAIAVSRDHGSDLGRGPAAGTAAQQHTASQCRAAPSSRCERARAARA